MNKRFLTVVDTTQVQTYIFGSNRLRENIGASRLVHLATNDWARNAVPSGTPEEDVVYSGGGNFVVILNDEDVRRFTRTLSVKVLEAAPGLRIAIASEAFEELELGDAFNRVFRKLSEIKRSKASTQPLAGLGVTAMCRSTGLPATAVDPSEPDRPVSAETLGKLHHARNANHALSSLFKEQTGGKYNFPADFDEMGRSREEHSYIAIVHIDGNAVGERFRQCKSIADFRTLSGAISKAGTTALQKTMATLISRIRNARISHPSIEWLAVSIAENNLPFRPLIFGGDDTTFVCDGRLALSLAVEYLRHFEKETEGLSGGKLTACAGISIVKSHYPFARAYALAEELCRNAKEERKRHGLQGSCVDWHFTSSGFSSGLQHIREREYRVGKDSLSLRPVFLDPPPAHAHRKWDVVEQGIRAFQQKDWHEQRNKTKALRDRLREGPNETARFLEQIGRTLPVLNPAYSGWPKTGWHGSWCGYYDALEAMDWYLPFGQEKQA